MSKEKYATRDETLALKSRAEQILKKRHLWNRQLWDIYDYILPFRESSGMQASETGRGRAEGESRTDKLFDSTAIECAFRFAGRLQQQLTPVFQTFATLGAGALVPDGDQKKQLTEQLQKIGEIVSAVINGSNFHQRGHEMYLDLVAGNGAMLILPGDQNELVRFVTVPATEVGLDNGPYGDVWHIVWARKWKGADIRVLWPDGTYSDTLKTKLQAGEKDNSDITVYQYTYYEPSRRKWCLKVWVDKDDPEALLWQEETRTKPWLTPRFFAVPGEPYGRGPGHLALPNVKTVNKARELDLMAAAFAIMGIWTYQNDGVFNPDTARFEPLAFWPVASNGGGGRSKSIERLPVAQDFKISQVVLEDERMSIKALMFNDTLPADSGAVRSATEISERMRRLSQDLAGVFGRLTLEIVVPLYQRVIEILEDGGKLPTNINIDQITTQLRVIAPIAASQQADRASSLVNWMQTIAMLLGQQMGPQAILVLCRAAKSLPELGRYMGVDEQFIGSDQEIAQMVAAMAHAAAAQQQAANAPPPATPDQQSAGLIANGANGATPGGPATPGGNGVFGG